MLRVAAEKAKRMGCARAHRVSLPADGAARRARRRAVRRRLVELRRHQLRAASSRPPSRRSRASSCPAHRSRGSSWDGTFRGSGRGFSRAATGSGRFGGTGTAAPSGEALGSRIRHPRSSGARSRPTSRETRRAPLGFVLPPSYASGWLERRPRLLAALARVERAAQRCQPLAALADHYIFEARRLPARDV